MSQGPCLCGDPWCKRCFPFREDEGERICNNCGEVIPADEDDCPYCDVEDENGLPE